MILAGPGTGKTATLVGRIAHLIQADGLSPDSILALTFTERAAGELKHKIAMAVGSDTVGHALSAATFHSFCYRIVLEFRPEYAEHILMTEGDALFMLQERYDEFPQLQSQQFRIDPILAIKSCIKFFSRLNDELISMDQLAAKLQQSASDYDNLKATGKADDGDLEQLHQLRDLCSIYPLYNQWKAAEGFIDYGDMITGCWEILQNHTHLNELQQRYQTVVVDEFQDNNYALNLVVDKLVAQHSSITVVGDEDQCIYSFRGANPINFIRFEERYSSHPQFAKILLQINYRSTQPIIDLASGVINENSARTTKAFMTNRVGMTKPEVLIADAKTHATELAYHIASLVESGSQLADLAVLVRSNKQARDFVTALSGLNLPSTFQDINFFQLPAIRTALAWFALIGKTDHAGLGAHRVVSTVLNRIPTSDELMWVMNQLGMPLYRQRHDHQVTPDNLKLTGLVNLLKELLEQADKHTADQMARDCLVRSRLYRKHYTRGNYSDRVALINLNHLLELSTNFSRSHAEATLGRFYNYLIVMSSTGSIQPALPDLDGAADAVKVLTIHQSKGLQFKHVLMGKLASGSFPTNYRKPNAVNEPPMSWRRYRNDEADAKAEYYAEERRIFYVGLTRAQDQITLLVPEKRKSPLVKNIPSQLITETIAMATTDTTEQSAGAKLIMQLKSELAKELGGNHYDNARQLIDAIDIADQLARGLKPDYSQSPIADRLMAAFSNIETDPVPQSELIELSASRMDDYERCGLMYKFKHIEKIPPSVANRPFLVFGNLIHNILEVYHSHEGDQQVQLLDILALKWDLSKYDFKQQAAEYRTKAEDALKQYAAFLEAQQYPPSTLAVEHQFRFQLGEAMITGRIDHIYKSANGGINLIDYKTSRKMDQKAAEKKLQLAVYAIYCEQAKDVELQGTHLGRSPEAVTFLFVGDPDPEVRIQYSPDALLLHREHIQDITSNIRKKIFEPTVIDRNCEYCDYKDLICPKWEKES